MNVLWYINGDIRIKTADMRKQDKQYITCNVTLRRVTKLLLLWTNNKYCILMCVFVCSLNYPACKEHEQCYTVICGPPDSTVFFEMIS